MERIVRERKQRALQFSANPVISQRQYLSMLVISWRPARSLYVAAGHQGCKRGNTWCVTTSATLERVTQILVVVTVSASWYAHCLIGKAAGASLPAKRFSRNSRPAECQDCRMQIMCWQHQSIIACSLPSESDNLAEHNANGLSKGINNILDCIAKFALQRVLTQCILVEAQSQFHMSTQWAYNVYIFIGGTITITIACPHMGVRYQFHYQHTWSLSCHHMNR